MRRIKTTWRGLATLLVAASLPVLTGMGDNGCGCATTCPPKPLPPAQPTLGNIGLISQPAQLGTLPAALQGSWYASVLVSAAPAGGEPGGTSELTVHSESSAKDFWKALLRSIGADDGTDSFSFAVTPTLNGAALPAMTAIQLNHTNSASTGETVTITTNAKVYSPWVPMDFGLPIKLQADGISSKQPDFKAFSNLSSAMSKVTTAGLWAVPAGSAASLAVGALSAFAGPIDGVVSNFGKYASNVTWNITNYVPNEAAGQPSGYVFTMYDFNNKPLATITVSYQFRRSLRKDPELVPGSQIQPNLGVTPAYPDMSSVDPNSPAFETLQQGNPNPVTIDSVLVSTQAALVTALNSPSPSNLGAFKTACGNFRDFLTNNGLDTIDSVFYRVKYLAPIVNQPANQPLASTFWGNCMSAAERATAAQINVVSDIHDTVKVDKSSLFHFGTYVVRQTNSSSGPADPADAATVQGMLASAGVGWHQGDVTKDSPPSRAPADVVTYLGLLPKTRGSDGFYCYFEKQSSPYGWTMFLAAPVGPAPVDQVLELTTGADDSSPIYDITYRAPKRAEFDTCKSWRADPTNPHKGPPPQGPEPAN